MRRLDYLLARVVWKVGDLLDIALSVLARFCLPYLGLTFSVIGGAWLIRSLVELVEKGM